MVTAYLELLEQGILAPSVDHIAQRAGVSTRAVFRHFRDREGFLAEVADRQIARLATLAPSLPQGGTSRSQRVREFACRWAVIHETVAPVRRAALQQEACSPTLAKRLAWAHDLLMREAGAVFAPELATLAVAERELRQCMLAAVVSFGIWDQLRRYRGLERDRAEEAVVTALDALLA